MPALTSGRHRCQFRFCGTHPQFISHIQTLKSIYIHTDVLNHKFRGGTRATPEHSWLLHNRRKKDNSICAWVTWPPRLNSLLRFLVWTFGVSRRRLIWACCYTCSSKTLTRAFVLVTYPYIPCRNSRREEQQVVELLCHRYLQTPGSQ